MKPLRDLTGDDDALLARAAELLAATRPVEMEAGARRRVRAAVRARRSHRRGAWRAVLAVAILALLIGSASAWVARHRRRAPIAPPAPPVAVAPATTAPPMAEPATIPPPITAPPTVAPAVAPAARRHRASGQDAEAALIVRAVKQLRRDHDAKGAAELLDRCARLHPNGILREEAQALRVEAAAQLDPRRARALADEYLARYPNGRFRAEVARVAGGGR